MRAMEESPCERWKNLREVLTNLNLIGSTHFSPLTVEELHVVADNVHLGTVGAVLGLPAAGRGFSRGCAHPAMQPPIFATHPHHQRKRTGAPLAGLQPEEDH